MSRRASTSRSLGAAKRCAVYLRCNGRCVWCARAFGESAADRFSVDHLDGDHRNNTPENLAGSHVGCNRARAWDWKPGLAWSPEMAMRLHSCDVNATFDVYLEARGADIVAAIARVEAQRRQELDLRAGKALAEQWHPGRAEQVRKAQDAYRDRKRAERTAA